MTEAVNIRHLNRNLSFDISLPFLSVSGTLLPLHWFGLGRSTNLQPTATAIMRIKEKEVRENKLGW